MQQTYDTPGEVTVTLEIANGDVAVSAADTERTSIEISGYDKSTPPRVSCEPVAGGYRVTIEHRSKRGWGFSFGRNPSFELTVPIGTRIDGSTGSTELEVRGSLGSLAYRTGSGDVSFEEITGDVQIACASGDVSGDAIGGHLSFKGASGDLDIGSIAGGALIRSASGDISVRRLDGPSTLTVGSGDIELREVGAGLVNVRAISGDVQIGVREGMGIWMDVSSTSGDVRSGLDPVPRGEASDGEPQLELTVSTVSGDVDINRVTTSKR
jgi:DUF4097 and DUF4098 domain-containing protein YvlB